MWRTTLGHLDLVPKVKILDHRLGVIHLFLVIYCDIGICCAVFLNFSCWLLFWLNLLFIFYILYLIKQMLVFVFVFFFPITNFSFELHLQLCPRQSQCVQKMNKSNETLIRWGRKDYDISIVFPTTWNWPICIFNVPFTSSSVHESN